MSTEKQSLSNVHSSVTTENKIGWRKLLAFIGPAYLVSVGYMDPGNWATDIAGGSAFGYKLPTFVCIYWRKLPLSPATLPRSSVWLSVYNYSFTCR
jgi:hypothetical protein